MKRRSKLKPKRTAAFLLLLLLTLLPLYACTAESGTDSIKEENKNNMKGLKKARPEHVYRVSYLEGRPGEGEYISGISAVGDKIYVAAYFSKPKELDEEAAYDSGLSLYSLNLDGSDFKQLISFADSSTKNEDGSTLYRSAAKLTPCPDGSFWYFSQETLSGPSQDSYKSSGRLIHAMPDGAELNVIDTAELSQSPYFYISSMFPCPNGDLVLTTYDSVSVIDAEGALKYSIPTNGAYYYGLTITGSGEIVGIKSTYDMLSFTSSSILVRLNESSRAFEEIGALPVLNTQYLIGGEGSTVIINCGSSVYSYDIMSGKLSELINWINSDMNYNRLSNLTMLQDGNFIVAESSADYKSVTLALLSPKPESEIAEKYILTLASVYMDSNLQDALISFNRQNEEFRIQYLDYSVYNTFEDPAAGYTRLSNDIMAGQAADLFTLSGLPYGVFAAKGLLEDVAALMAPDRGFDKSLYLENIINAPAFRGKIYSVIPSFSLMTIAGKSENVGTGLSWTMEELQTLMQKYPEAAAFLYSSRSTILSYFNMMALSSYIDEEAGTCSFNTPSFYKVLEFIKGFPEEVDYGNIYTIGTGREYRDNKALLCAISLYGYSQIRDIIRLFGADISFVGFPVPEGMGSSIVPTLELAISSGSAFKAICWDFVRSFLSEDYQSSISYGFPVMKSVLDKMARAAINAAVSNVNPGGSAEEPVTQAQIDLVNKTLSSVSSVQRYNKEIFAIIEEEAGEYFDGAKTAEAAAEAIQGRVQDYLYGLSK